MDRASSKHGRHLDEQLEREVRPYLQGPPNGGRVSPWREAEMPGEDDPGMSQIPRLDPMPYGDATVVMSPEEREGRSRLGVYLTRSAFPADRDGLLNAARTALAPDTLLAEMQSLPFGREYETVAEVWTALGYPADERF